MKLMTLKPYEAEDRGFIPLTKVYREGEKDLLNRALSLLTTATVCLVQYAEGVEIWRKSSEMNLLKDDL